jgi:hypothetical protein
LAANIYGIHIGTPTAQRCNQRELRETAIAEDFRECPLQRPITTIDGQQIHFFSRQEQECLGNMLAILRFNMRNLWMRLQERAYASSTPGIASCTNVI